MLGDTDGEDERGELHDNLSARNLMNERIFYAIKPRIFEK